MSLLLSISAPMGSTSHTHTNGHGHANGIGSSSNLLQGLLDNPLIFGEPVGRASFAPKMGLREVLPGPPSPPRGVLRLEPVKEVPKAKEADERQENESGMNGDEEEGRKEKRIRLGPSTPPHLRKPLPDLEPSTTSSTLMKPPSSSPKSKTKINGQASIPSTPTQNDPSSSSTATSSSQKSLHPPIPDSALSFPPNLTKNKSAAGLYNPSMACYANATLQVMMHTPPFLREALNHPPKDCLLIHNNRFCLLCMMRSMITDHWSQKAYRPQMVHGSLGVIKKGFSKNRQEDTHEFFRFACDALQNSALAGLPKNLSEATKHTTWVHRIWGGRVRSRVVCSKCDKPSDTFDHFLDLSLDCGAGKKSILAMLQGFIKEDKLEGDNKYHCERCKVKANATKSFKIAEAPPVLTLHLKRFSMNYNSWNGKARADKYNQHIAFDEYLDIAKYMVDPNSGTNGPSTKYKLFGVTCHRGAELRYGHYTAYVRAPSGSWYQADDEDMSPISLNSVKNDKTAYLLSYIRLAEGEEIPAGAQSGHVNGNGNTVGVNGLPGGAGWMKNSKPTQNVQQQGGKRKRDDEAREETMRQPIRKNIPSIPSNLPLFPSSLNGGTQVPFDQNPPSPSRSDKTVEDDNGPDRMSAFGARMNETRVYAPKAMASAEFYGKSPIPRPQNPGPHGRGNGGNGGNRRDRRRGKGNVSPFDTPRGGGGGKNGGGGGKNFGGKQKGVYTRMQGKR